MRKSFAVVAASIVAFTSNRSWAGIADTTLAKGCDVRVGFSPHRGGMDLVIALINAAGPGQEVDVDAYEFTSHRMVHALRAALSRHATLKLAVDATENVGKPYSMAYQFVGVPGAEVRYEDHWPVFHEKVTLVRSLDAVEEGSMNYTDRGDTKNRENANLMTRCAGAAQAYKDDFDDLWAQGTRFGNAATSRRMKGGWPKSTFSEAICESAAILRATDGENRRLCSAGC